MNRQSVPFAIIFFWLALIIPTSWRRRAWQLIATFWSNARQRQYERGVDRRLRHERDVAGGIEAHVRRHAGDEDVMGGSPLGDGDRLALEIADRADALGPEELVAADVDPREENDRRARVHLHDEGRDERHTEVDLAVGEGRVHRA